MGNGLAVNGSSLAPVTLDDHIEVRRYINTDNGGYYSYSTRDATVNGNIVQNEGNVYVNDIPVARRESITNETDSYNLGIWSYVSGAHTDITSGYISGGSQTVFVNGFNVARLEDTVATHGGETTTINSGSNYVFAG